MFLAFDVRRGITKTKNNSHLNFNLSFNTVVKMLNNLANNKKLKIIIKYKHNSGDKIDNKISKKIKIFKTGSAEKFINNADIVIGHNSAQQLKLWLVENMLWFLL